MNTEYFNVSPGNPNADAIARAGAILRRGGLVAFPTETVYGLVGNALDPDASALLQGGLLFHFILLAGFDTDLHSLWIGRFAAARCGRMDHLRHGEYSAFSIQRHHDEPVVFAALQFCVCTYFFCRE